MASTYSQLKIELIGTGEQSGTWGATTNTNLGTAIEEAITGSVVVPFSNTDVTLTLSNTNASQSARNLRLNLTGTASSALNLTVPDIEKFYLIANDLTYEVVVKNSTGTTYTVPAGTTAQVFSTGAGIKDGISFFQGELLSSAAYILGGEIDSTPIGAITPSTVRSTNLTVNGNTILGDASGDTVDIRAAAWTLTNSPTVTGTWTNLGTVTTTAINGGTINGVTIGGSSPAAATVTNLTVNGNTILGDASGDTVQVKAAAWTLTNSPTVTGTWANLGTVTTTAINGGTINGVTIGGSSAGAITGTSGTFSSLSDSGNLTFTGTANRITGDFSNATYSNRVAFQTSTADSNTVVGVLPNGSATGSSYQVYNNSTLTNASLASLEASSSAVTLASSIRGSGTYLPMAFNVNGSESLRLLTTGAISFGSSGTAYGTSGQVLTSQGSGAAPTWTTNGSGTVTSITAGTGLSGGTITTSGTVSIDTAVTVDVSTAQTLTNKRITTRSLAAASATGTITPASDTYDQVNYLLTGTVAFAVPSGTPTNGQKLNIRLYAASTQTVSWTTSSTGYRVIGTTLPTSVASGKTVYVGCVWNSTDSYWDVVAVATQA